MKIVRGPLSGAPVLLVGKGFVYLGKGVRHAMSGNVGEFKPMSTDSAFINADPYTAPLTDKEEAIAMKAILLHG